VSHPKTASTDHDVLDVIRHRWSPRAFDPSRDVTKDELLRLFEAARWAPSSGNEQPWRFVVTHRTLSTEQHAAMAKSLLGRNPLWASSAPVLALVCVRTMLERKASVNQHAWYDTGQAVGFLTLQATSMGLSIRQMEGFDPVIARETCQVPPEFDPAVVMAIGYAGDPSLLTHDSHREAEQRPRTRRQIDEFVFWGSWDGGRTS
jgi:nitroreductase